MTTNHPVHSRRSNVEVVLTFLIMIASFVMLIEANFISNTAAMSVGETTVSITLLIVCLTLFRFHHEIARAFTFIIMILSTFSLVNLTGDNTLVQHGIAVKEEAMMSPQFEPTSALLLVMLVLVNVFWFRDLYKRYIDV
ncbi:MAG TPA: hypothetical protein PLW14_11380 [Chlorobiota bacterium]|nr:hypothetical protein [Chlorobiota bacterium]